MGLDTLIDRNLQFTERFDKGALGIPPRLSTLIVTCLDARVDPTYFFGLELGDSFVMRNIGGRVTDEIVEHIAILQALTDVAGGDPFELALIHHTDCGTTRFADPEIARTLSNAAGIGASIISKLGTADPHASVQTDLARLRDAAMLRDDMIVGGYVYDVTDGRLEAAVPPAPLRAAPR